ncbi:MAG: hypothetical protein KAH93_02225 [Candidatus Aenigmarchaeota archaeon]|nr:hypothetical protein [Candidatus Aenigmarchaeota archaeon]
MENKLFEILGIFLVVLLATNVVAAQEVSPSITIEEPAENAFVSGNVIHVSGTYACDGCGIVVYSETAGTHRFTFNVATLEEDEWKTTLFLENKSDVYDLYVIVHAGLFEMDELPDASSLASDWEKALASDTIVVQHGEKVEKGLEFYISQYWWIIGIIIAIFLLIVIIRLYYSHKDKRDNKEEED